MITDQEYERSIAAFAGYGGGKRPEDIVTLRPYGTHAVRIMDAFSASMNYPPTTINADDIPVFDAAFRRHNTWRPSDQVDKCAKAIVEIIKRLNLPGHRSGEQMPR
jgi:hypothetical protein